ANVAMKNVDGKMVSIVDVRGENGILVIFTCNSCPWAQAWSGRIAQIGNEFQAKGIGVVAINSNDTRGNAVDDYEHMQQEARDLGLRFPYVVDATSEMARAFGASHTPEAFLFNKEGSLVYHGAIDDNAHNPEQVKEQYLRSALEAVVQNSEVPVKETKAIGCGIRFRSS
ncbi:MAG: thioredoxin family protein, partial [Calditrichota bacterium]